MKLTLDWNCVIEVEEGRAQSDDVKELVRCHREGRFEVALLAASASENSRTKRFPGNGGFFRERILALGWQDLPVVLMPCIPDLSYIELSYIICDGELFERDIEAIWSVVAPKIPRNPREFLPSEMELNSETIQSPELSRWRNTWCDVVSAYSHIHDGRDIFVTNNTRDFQDNAQALSALGMRHICRPSETLATVVKMVEGAWRPKTSH